MKAIILLSGGMDSTVVLALVKERGDTVTTLTVDYGQRHRREVDAAARIADHYNVPNTVVTLDPRLFAGSSLTTGAGEPPDSHADEPDSTLVPGRNTVLLALGTAYAESLGGGNVVIGANSGDAGGYPDCRGKFIESFRETVGIGTAGKVWVTAPLLSLTKTEIAGLARELQVPLGLAYSCYRGGEKPCNTCGACISRNEAQL